MNMLIKQALSLEPTETLVILSMTPPCSGAPDTAIYDSHGMHVSNCRYWAMSEYTLNWLRDNGYTFGALHVAKIIKNRKISGSISARNANHA